MINKSLVKYSKSLLGLLLLLSLTTIVNGQVQLQQIKVSECNSNDYTFKPIYKQVWLNDSILQIETAALANCIGVFNPRVKMHGPLLWLEFDQFKIDTCISPLTHKRGEMIQADCNCVYRIWWTLKGIKKGTETILLLNRQLSSDYNKELLDQLLSAYEIENDVKYFFLRNVVDENGIKQGIHTFRDEKENVTRFKEFHEGVEEVGVPSN